MKRDEELAKRVQQAEGRQAAGAEEPRAKRERGDAKAPAAAAPATTAADVSMQSSAAAVQSDVAMVQRLQRGDKRASENLLDDEQAEARMRDHATDEWADYAARLQARGTLGGSWLE